MGMALIFLSVFTLAHAFIPTPVCVKEGQLIPHQNCNQFYKCSEGIPAALKCPENLLYRPATKQCDWPEKVNCRGRMQPNNDNDNTDGEEKEEVVLVSPQAICESQKSEGTLVPHDNCNKFYICSNGLPVEFSCQPYLLYNPATQQCDWPENVTCKKTDYASEASVTCSKDGSEGILLPNQQCNRFYMCASGVPVSYDCPATLVYNYLTELCDWPEQVQCGDRTKLVL